MSKRHQASRRRAYGRRQHEVRERTERPVRDRIDGAGITVHDIEGYDEHLLERLFAAEPLGVPRSVMRASAD